MDDRSELMKEFELIIPPLTYDTHKGQAGRIGIVGGCISYTGAPYFAAISALRVGCDLVHVFCTKEAAQVIKSYSPELIVHPILDSPNFNEEILLHLPSMHSLVIGPGLGRDKDTFFAVHHLVDLAKKRNLPLVFDADSLFFLKDTPKLIESYQKAILTPNKVEFARLYSSLLKEELTHDPTENDVKQISEILGNVTIVKKGTTDIISNGFQTLTCNEPGSARRCGGQGDLLSGSMGVFNYWAHKLHENKPKDKSSLYSATVLAAFGACMLTRRCNNLAFKKFQRSTITTDMIGEIHNAFTSLFERAV
ncbi:ATP-dependent (S)-NAD(P)H-hydrate dehydratase [Araneus ventricosus]|uniref:ATP-dependent (S)-NAD(P)H-hydrate dehydratase n=1 Tax=Araneus ventricosus TaxID=182803 RepID=A0A4Y2F4W4_ARAVE|nr:ATP-dependent (S)-NAD(P)H-hydrate dehydratase [Araneus ventricosus]